MRFQGGLSEEEVLGLFEAGTYKFHVEQAQDKVSKSNNEYISMKLKLTNSSGKERSIFTNMALPYMIKHFCEITGMPEKWNSSELMAKDCIGKQGYCKVFVKIDKSGEYAPKNEVQDYVVTPGKAEEDKEPFKDDELPF